MKERTIAKTAYIIVMKCPYDEIGHLRVSDIAQRCNVSTPYLCRSFRKKYGFTLQLLLDAFLALRFDLVADGMLEPTLKKVLTRMKIKDKSYFIKRYKKIMDQTPGSKLKLMRFTKFGDPDYRVFDEYGIVVKY